MELFTDFRDVFQVALKMKKILIIQYGDLKREPRTIRQIEALKDIYKITTLAIGPSYFENIAFEQIYSKPSFNLFRKLKRALLYLTLQFDDFYWDDYRKSISEKLRNQNFDLIISHDINTLPLALNIANGKSKVIFDSHDYHPEEFNNNLFWRIKDKVYINFLCKQYIPKADVFTSSSESIAFLYQDYINIKPIVFYNAREYYELNPSIIEDKIKLVHHGAAIRSRKLEKMIDVLEILGEKYELYFYLTNLDPGYLNSLKNKAKHLNNVFFEEPVNYYDIVPTINKYDIGIFYVDGTNVNYQNSLGNKIFEFVQARLCCVVSPVKEMKNIVNKFNLGLVSQDYSTQTMANEILELSKTDIMNFKINCSKAALELSNNENQKRFSKVVEDLIN